MSINIVLVLPSSTSYRPVHIPPTSCVSLLYGGVSCFSSFITVVSRVASPPVHCTFIATGSTSAFVPDVGGELDACFLGHREYKYVANAGRAIP